MVGTTSVRQTIESANRQFEAAFNRGDTVALAALYTEDATVLPPGAPSVHGREAIQQFWQSVRDAGVRTATLATQDVQASGDYAHEIGAATLQIQPEGGAASTEQVKYVVVWKRQPGGTWQLHVDIWNANA
jgi:uncharacterized protein (TIGR02246 family)